MPLNETIDKLASFEPTDLPVISLYLNTQADQHGRDNFDSFVRVLHTRRSMSRMTGEEELGRANRSAV